MATEYIVITVNPAEFVAAERAAAEAAAAAAEAAQAIAEQKADATEADAAQTALDRIATGEDATATAADRVATGQDRLAAEQAAQTAANEAAAAAAAIIAAAVQATSDDAAQTALDRIATGEDRTQTGLDRIQTGEDADTATTQANLAEAARVAAVIAQNAAALSASNASTSATNALNAVAGQFGGVFAGSAIPSAPTPPSGSGSAVAGQWILITADGTTASALTPAGAALGAVAFGDQLVWSGVANRYTRLPTSAYGFAIAATTNAALAARAPLSGLHFTGTGSRLTQPTAGPNVKGGDWFVRVKAVTPATRDSTTRALACLQSDLGSTNNRVTLQIGPSSYAVSLQVRSTTTESIGLGAGAVLAASTAYELLLAYTHATGAFALYANGSAIGTVTLTGSQITEYAAITALQRLVLGNIDNAAAGNTTDCTIQSAEYGNVALTASEVSLLHRFGWAALPQYVHDAGPGVPIISPSLRNGGFETLGSLGTSPFADWFGAPALSIAVESADVFAGAQSCRLTGSGSAASSGNNHFNSGGASLTGFVRNSGWAGAKSARVRFAAKYVSGGSLYLSNSYQVLRTVTPGEATAWTLFDWNGTIPESVIYQAPVFSADASAVWLLDNVTVTPVGLCGSWTFDGTGAGYQERDRSGGRRPLLLTTTGVERLQRGDRIQVTATVAHGSAGNLQITGQSVLPDLGWRLVAATAKASANVTVQLGSASGGAQVVGSTAMTSGTLTALTVASTGIKPTTVNVWSNASAAASIEYSLVYERDDIL
jgi:hypothetical protein